MRRILGAWFGTWFCLLFLLIGNGCDMIALVADAAETIPAEHELANVPTLIMIEDRQLHLEDPSVMGYMANAIAGTLIEQEILQANHVVNPDGIAKLRQEFGVRYNNLAIDEIGRRLGADQVLYVEIVDVNLRVAPGLYRPEATAKVKVIDALKRQRLYPATQSLEGVTSAPSGRAILVRLSTQTPDIDDRSFLGLARQQLAEALAQDIAKLFYRHLAQQPGSSF